MRIYLAFKIAVFHLLSHSPLLFKAALICNKGLSPSLDQRICCCPLHRRLIKLSTVDSAKLLVKTSPHF